MELELNHEKFLMFLKCMLCSYWKQKRLFVSYKIKSHYLRIIIKILAVYLKATIYIYTKCVSISITFNVGQFLNDLTFHTTFLQNSFHILQKCWCSILQIFSLFIVSVRLFVGLNAVYICLFPNLSISSLL